MSKASTIRLLYAERCSASEIAAVIGWRVSDVLYFIRHWIADEK